jgi:hypothetical protein
VSPALRHSTILSDFQSVEECAVLPNLANNVLVPIPKLMPEKNVLVEPVDIARELELIHKSAWVRLVDSNLLISMDSN